MSRPGLIALAVLPLLAAGLVLPAHAASCPSYDGVRGANAAPVDVGAEVTAAATRHAVPAPILAGLAFVEGYDAASTRHWVQFRADGSPLVAADCGVGITQVTGAPQFDQTRLASDWRYNLDAGATVLRQKWEDSQAANPSSLGPDDEAVLENWWPALYRYNGTGTAAASYADAVFAAARDPLFAVAPFTVNLPTLRTPGQVFADFTPQRQFQGRMSEAVLTDDAGTVLARDAGFRPTLPPAAPRPAAPRVASDATTPSQVGISLSRTVFADAGSPDGHGSQEHQARHAVLARDDDYADALTAASLSGSWGPVLFAPGGPGGALPDGVRAELLRVLPAGSAVYLAGGTAALSPAVEDAVRAGGLRPVRLAGPDRLETAVAVSRELRRLDPSAGQLLVARAFDTPADALTGGAIAAVSHRPLVLAPTAGLPTGVRDEIAGLGPKAAVLLGGTAALSDRVAADLRAGGLSVSRVAGVDRFATAAMVAGQLGDGVRREAVAVDLASPAGWPWALAAAPLSALLGGPQLGVAPGSVPPPITAALSGAGGSVGDPVRVVVVGGDERVSVATRNALAAAARGQ